MEHKVPADQLPAQAHLLYVQLYCERKGEKDKKTIQEAKKSWTSLSSYKKKKFCKTTADRNLIKYVHGLSKTKAYLKEKVPKLNDKMCKPQQNNEHQARNEQQKIITSTNEQQEIITSTNEEQGIVTSTNESYLTENRSQLRENELGDEIDINITKLGDTNETQIVNIDSPMPQANEGRPLQELNSSNYINNTELQDACDPQEMTECPCEPNPSIQNDEMEDALETQSDISSVQRTTIPIAEPTPPTVKIGKDLYDVIKHPGSAEWKDLTRKDRVHYNSAVRVIKREYIKNYIKYLESLSQQQLFDHYSKTLCN